MSRLRSRRAWEVEEVFSRVLFALVACALLTALFAGVRLSSSIVIVVFLAGALFIPRRLAALPYWVYTGLAVFAIALSIVTALYPVYDFESVLLSIVGLMIWTIAIAYFVRRGPRMDAALVLLALLLMAVTTVLNSSIRFLVMFIIFVGLVLSALMLMAVRQEVRTPDAEAPPTGRAALPPRFFALPAAATVAIFAAGFIIFFFIPRMGRGLFARKITLQARVTGFSETIELGQVGEILQSNALVMRVQLEGAGPRDGPFYLRGGALDLYTGKGWRDSRGIRQAHYMRFQQVLNLAPIKSLDGLIKQEIILEPVNTDILFAIPQLKSILLPFPQRMIYEYDNDYIGLASRGPIYDRLSYTVWSRRAPRGIDACRRAEAADPLKLDDPLIGSFLDLPPGTERVAELGQEKTRGQADKCGQIFELRKFLGDGFTYDLNPPAEAAANPIEDFLFNSRRGYCEYFATAMALMLRANRIPCRVATGYLANDYNSIEDFYRVRESSAHAWVEVLMNDGSWLLVDPTPAAPPTSSSSAAYRWLSDLADSVIFRWDRYIVDLSLQDQYHFALRARDRSQGIGRTLAQAPRTVISALRALLTGVTPVLVIIGALILWRLLRKRPPEDPDDPARSELARRYQALLVQLARRGIKRRDPETLVELGERLETELPRAAEPFRVATRLYLDARFGGRPTAHLARRAIDLALTSLKRK